MASASRDIYADPRIPHSAYRPTFVRSLAILPLGHESPVGSLGVYWANEHAATEREMFLLDVLAEAASAALSHTERWQQVAQLQSRGAVQAETPTADEEPMLMRLMPIGGLLGQAAEVRVERLLHLGHEFGCRPGPDYSFASAAS